MAGTARIILGIDPGLAHTGWGVVEQCGSRLGCVAYGCVATPASVPLAERLLKIHHQVGAVVERFRPTCVGIETVWFGNNVTAAFATGQARGAALVACAEMGLDVGSTRRARSSWPWWAKAPPRRSRCSTWYATC